MNKVEPIGNEFHVVRYDGDGFEVISKKYKTLHHASIALDKINEQKNNKLDDWFLIKYFQNAAINDVTLAKVHGSIAITDTKCGTIFIEHWGNVFAMRFGEKQIVTDNEIMVIDILKGLYKFKIIETYIKEKENKMINLQKKLQNSLVE